MKAKDSDTIETVDEACAYMLALPKHVQQHNAWQHAARLCIEVRENPTPAAVEALTD